MAKTKIVKGKGKKDVLDTDYLYGDWLAGGMAGGAVRGAKADVKKKKRLPDYSQDRHKKPDKHRKRAKVLQQRQATAKGRSGQDAVEEFYERVDRAKASRDGGILGIKGDPKAGRKQAMAYPRDKEHKAWRKKRMDRSKGGGL